MKHNWEYKRLGDVCFTKKEIGRASTYYGVDDEISYFDISSIDNSVNRVTSYSTTTFGDAPSRAQQVIENGDVLFSLVRPNLKNIALLNSDAANKVGTSGFCVLRGKNVLPKYVLHFVLSSQFTEYILSKASGASYPAVTEDDVRKASIPVPTMEIQEQIVGELDKINELIEQNRELLHHLDSLAQSLFYDTFGDPVTNPKGWELHPFSDVFKLNSGDGLSAKQIIPGQYPVYGGNGIVGYHQNYNVDGNNVIIGRVGALCGNVRNVKNKAFVTDNAFIVTQLKALNQHYTTFMLNILNLRQYAKAVAQPVISNVGLKKILIQVPPLAMQEQFAAQVEAIEEQKVTIEKSIAELQTLLDSRMDYWFN